MFWNTFPLDIKSDLCNKFEIDLISLTVNQIEELKSICEKLELPIPNDLDEIRVLDKSLDKETIELLDFDLSDYYTSFSTAYDLEVKEIQIGESNLEFTNLFVSDNVELVDESDGFTKDFRVRKEFNQRFIGLCQSAKLLNLGVRVLDAFRPLEIQKSKFENTLNRLSNKFPDMSFSDVLETAAVNTACAPWIAAHMSGAAVDLYLFDLETGNNVDIGNEYRSLSCISNMNYPFLSFEQFKNRFIFQMLCVKHGFVVYHAENWHISYGDLMWARESSKKKSLYEPVHSITSDGVIALASNDFYKNFNEIVC